MPNYSPKVKADIYLPSSINESLIKSGIKDYLTVEQIHSGGNSHVFVIESNYKKYIIKKYFTSYLDPRDRLQTEFSFLKYLETIGVTCVPKPVGFDQEQRYGFYSYLEGIKIECIHDLHIKQAANFIRMINFKYQPLSFQPASEACFTYRDHINNIRFRIEKLKSDLMDKESDIEKRALAFLMGKFLSEFEVYEMDTSVDFYKDQRILSPSDFGFHNMLEFKGDINFIDFEYAGEDGLSKLIADFLCQPEKQITKSQADIFINKLTNDFNINLSFLSRIIKLSRFKWTCIILNVFHNYNLLKKNIPSNQKFQYLDARLDKAINYYLNHTKDSN